MFETTDESIRFDFDDSRRLRIAMVDGLLPIAAWLHTDVQANLAGLESFGTLLTTAKAGGHTINGNGCAVRFEHGEVVLESLYDRWEPLRFSEDLLVAILTGLRAFLRDSAADPRLARAANFPEPTRMVTTHGRDDGSTVLIDHTYFPQAWSPMQVQVAADAAWASDDFLFDEVTGVWSGTHEGLEFAGYYDPKTGVPQMYFPVVAP
ncbi:EndoU domain-containing protein [Actinoalloteichus hymeniacidonis]|uniref:Uncharacterized protein n=1 Tax=Actinoalloteichus hymeniacidonis TaxID=340345 RepID=A0AAC9N0P9_9PSEU|nr:EndoU domain-containing protein [Actinoalloteichus hymeniacidonis]AOS65116.1 hypothetical protein TL08_21645 [Actinoalloteichus hymeniacidonis]MBB5906805.1 hypothetical protein [Actinoalloteichus hymeniacidonis]